VLGRLNGRRMRRLSCNPHLRWLKGGGGEAFDETSQSLTGTAPDLGPHDGRFRRLVDGEDACVLGYHMDLLNVSESATWRSLSRKLGLGEPLVGMGSRGFMTGVTKIVRADLTLLRATTELRVKQPTGFR